MTPSPRVFACSAALLALLPAAARAADTPAEAVVREFLADRASGKYADAYALLSSASQKGVTENGFAAGQPLPAELMQHQSDPLFPFAVLLNDTHNAQHYTFTVAGPDPADPNAVLVRAAPPQAAAGVPVLVLHLAVVTDPAAHAPRLDVMQSLRWTSPEMFAAAAQNAKRVLSQNNLKQIGLGIIQYEQDHDEIAPDAARWCDEILPYVGNKGVFRDPSAPASRPYNYAYNRALSHQSLAAMEMPAQTVMAFESTAGVKNASDTGQSVPRPGRYSGGSDYLFADGHVKWFKDGTKLSFELSGK